MSINRGEINPLNVLGFRKVSFIPEHFKTLTVPKKVDIKNIEAWIETNLNSRYAIQQTLSLDEANKIIEVVKIGLEDPKEISLLSLGCKHLYQERIF